MAEMKVYICSAHGLPLVSTLKVRQTSVLCIKCNLSKVTWTKVGLSRIKLTQKMLPPLFTKNKIKCNYSDWFLHAYMYLWRSQCKLIILWRKDTSRCGTSQHPWTNLKNDICSNFHHAIFFYFLSHFEIAHEADALANIDRRWLDSPQLYTTQHLGAPTHKTAKVQILAQQVTRYTYWDCCVHSHICLWPHLFISAAPFIQGMMCSLIYCALLMSS